MFSKKGDQLVAGENEGYLWSKIQRKRDALSLSRANHPSGHFRFAGLRPDRKAYNNKATGQASPGIDEDDRQLPRAASDSVLETQLL